jgi:malate synthase
MDDGRPVTQKLFDTLCQEEMASLPQTDSSVRAAEILNRLVVSDTFVEFLTSIAYDYLT